MEEILNKTETKTQNDFSNIREMQNIVKTNSLNSFAMNLKGAKQRLSSLGTKILDIKKGAGAPFNFSLGYIPRK